MIDHLQDRLITWGGGLYAVVLADGWIFQALAALGVLMGGLAQLLREIRESNSKSKSRP
jgi:hypothetical protein